ARRSGLHGGGLQPGPAALLGLPDVVDRHLPRPRLKHLRAARSCFTAASCARYLAALAFSSGPYHACSCTSGAKNSSTDCSRAVTLRWRASLRTAAAVGSPSACGQAKDAQGASVSLG